VPGVSVSSANGNRKNEHAKCTSQTSHSPMKNKPPHPHREHNNRVIWAVLLLDAVYVGSALILYVKDQSFSMAKLIPYAGLLFITTVLFVIQWKPRNQQSFCAHKWQTRGRNRYGKATYKMCLKCRKTFHQVNKSWEPEKWEQCDPIPELDDQFDSNDQFIF
jgi:hypothetical protein